MDGIRPHAHDSAQVVSKVCILKHNTSICQRLQLVPTIVCTLQMPAIEAGDYTSVPKVAVIGYSIPGFLTGLSGVIKFK